MSFPGHLPGLLSKLIISISLVQENPVRSANATFIEMTRVAELIVAITANIVKVGVDSMTYVARASIRAESEKTHFDNIALYKGYCRSFPPDTEVQYWVQKWTTGWDGFCHGWIKVVDGSWTNVYLSGTVFNSSCHKVM